jgi:serine protease Do
VNEENDLALLWVHDFDLTPVTWASGREVPVGTFVAASGSLQLPLAIGAVSLPLRNLSEGHKGFLGIQMKAAEDGSGLVVEFVVPGSGAESSGLEVDDLILAIDGQPMHTPFDLRNTVSEAEPGDIVIVQFVREGESVMLEVTLGDRDSGMGFSMPMHEQLDNTAMMGGRVSRKRSGYLAAIQHDMLMKPNQCGGPLVNLDGDVIGVNIARASRVKSYAIPSEVIQEWLGDPQDLARNVLETRMKNAEAARLVAEEALQAMIDAEGEVKNALEELEEQRAAALVVDPGSEEVPVSPEEEADVPVDDVE